MMIERILGILNLCLFAKEMGHDVFFDYAPHVQKVEVHAYKDGSTYTADEEPDILFRYQFYMNENETLANQTMGDMETAIQKLIDGEFE